MDKQLIELPEIHLVGIKARTNNKAEMTGDGVIMATVQRYDNEQLAEQIEHRYQPSVAYCAYTEYESDEHGDYTYFCR